MNPEKLDCISIVVCDEIFRDETTKKLIIVGVFNRISALALPCRHPRMTVLFSVTNGKGVYDLHVSLDHADGSQVLKLGGKFKIDNPLAISDINLSLDNVTFTKEGKHWISILVDGEIRQQRPFYVSLIHPDEAQSQ